MIEVGVSRSRVKVEDRWFDCSYCLEMIEPGDWVFFAIDDKAGMYPYCSKRCYRKHKESWDEMVSIPKKNRQPELIKEG